MWWTPRRRGTRSDSAGPKDPAAQCHPASDVNASNRPHWSVCESYSGAIFTFLSVTPVRDLPQYATLVVDKIAKSVAVLIYDILPVHLRGVARVHLGESATKDFFLGIFRYFLSRRSSARPDAPKPIHDHRRPSHSVFGFTRSLSCRAAERR